MITYRVVAKYNKVSSYNEYEVDRQTGDEKLVRKRAVMIACDHSKRKHDAVLTVERAEGQDWFIENIFKDGRELE